MPRSGARARHRRAPERVLRAEDGYFWGGMLLVVTFGLTLAAVEESRSAHDLGWFAFFVAFAAFDAVLYFLVVRWWLKVIDLNG